MGCLLFEIGDTTEAAVHLETAMKIHEHCRGRGQSTEVAMTATLESLGELCMELGRYGRAIQYYQQALELQEGHPVELERTAGILGVLSFELGRYSQAKNFLKTSLSHASEESEDVAGTLDYLGQVEDKLGYAKLAHSYHQQSLRMRSTRTG